MRVISRRSRFLLGNRPFAGTLGASLYVGTPDATDIRYRRHLVMGGAARLVQVSADLIDLGADEILKCLAVDQVASPTEELSYTLPAELIDVPLAVQVRTFANDRENQSIYRPILTGTDANGDQEDTILGAAVVGSPVKMDDGGVFVEWTWIEDPRGVQPDEFALVQTVGPGSLADAVVEARVGLNSIQIDGLTNATAYGWNLEARNGAVAVVVGTVEFTADDAGPSGVTAFGVVPN